MPPTPNLNNGVLRIVYTVPSLAHHIDHYVELLDPGSGDYSIVRNAPETGSDPGATVAQAMWDLFKALWTSAVTAPTYILFWKPSTSLIPVESAALTGTGSNGTTNKLATQLTITYRDDDQYEIRQQFMETFFSPPTRSPVGSIATAIDDITDSMVATPDGTAISTWVRSRHQKPANRGLFVSIDTNRKLRRARGL